MLTNAMTVKQPENYLRYWGKASKGVPASYHLLAWHSLDVAACGRVLLQQNRFGCASLFRELGFSDTDAAAWFGYLLASHDIGKFASGFQNLVAFPGSPLVTPAVNIPYVIRHDTLGYHLWQALFSSWVAGENTILPDVVSEERNAFSFTLDCLMAIATGHHGWPPDKTAQTVLSFSSQDISAAERFLCDLHPFFSLPPLPVEWKSKRWRRRLQQQSWLLAGITTLADWLGSDEHYFPFISQPMSLQQYWPLALERAEASLSRIPSSPNVSHYEGYQRLFPFIHRLTPLQQHAATLPVDTPGPRLIILEDVTGAGKTEAAMILTHRLISAGQGNGLYVGLPTMATANAMYLRLADCYRGFFSQDDRPSLVLAHGGRQMSDAFRHSIWCDDASGAQHYASNERSATGECNAWFADSRKKALLADVGVGTLDQILMAVMPFRHQSLRLLGMQNKVLVLDEVHAYDGYMVRLLEGVLHYHAGQGGSAIILSATLSTSLREKLLAAFSEGAAFPCQPPDPHAGYPWLTHLNASGLHEQELATREEVKRCVGIHWLTEVEQAIAIIYQAVEAGQCICWVRSTVDDACAVFQHLRNDRRLAEEDLLLFHSRFIFADRLRIENTALEWFGKAAPAVQRRGRVLIATQVVEQSLDLDFDMMISDLAPVDLLIQRAGRLQRHIRDSQGVCKSSLPDERPPPLLHILAPVWQEEPDGDWPGTVLRGTGYVYTDHACLWRTQFLLRQYGEIRMPEMARTLVDGVYEARIPTPPSLQKIEDDVFGMLLGQRAAASNNLLMRDIGYSRDASGYRWSEEKQLSTRLGEESVDVYLTWLDADDQLQPWVREGEFRWELSRVQVRAGWWQQRDKRLPEPDEQQLQALRRQLHRPSAQALLMSEAGHSPYYSHRLGLRRDIPTDAGNA